MRNILLLSLFFSSFFQLCLTVVPLFKKGILSEKRSKEKFYYNQEVPWWEASSEVSEPTVTPHPTGDKTGEPVANRFVQIIRGSLGVSPRDARPVSSVERAPVCWAGGREFKPWPDHQPRSLKNWWDHASKLWNPFLSSDDRVIRWWC